MNTIRKGTHWEKSAESFLHRHGLKTVRRNYRCRLGEIDLVMRDGTGLVFVEVRYRGRDSHGSGADTVGHRKCARIARTAALFLGRNPAYAAFHCRFDVISIGKADGRTEFNWIRNAFQSPLG
ncbi:MAG: YraN family protein [Xanthomonadales bacterium]|nr:YraN family protein [Xanthomonadales bacterium]NIX13259.1 YraN family protein [Xanthomonadales bacterium]